MDAISKKKNLSLSGKIGVHRTLSYLIPLLDEIEANQEKFITDYLENTETSSLFQPKELKSSTTHGAIIVVPYMEMVYSTYSLIRQLSPSLNIFRTNSIADIVGFSKYMQEDGAKDLKKKYAKNFRIKSMN